MKKTELFFGDTVRNFVHISSNEDKVSESNDKTKSEEKKLEYFFILFGGWQQRVAKRFDHRASCSLEQAHAGVLRKVVNQKTHRAVEKF